MAVSGPPSAKPSRPLRRSCWQCRSATPCGCARRRPPHGHVQRAVGAQCDRRGQGELGLRTNAVGVPRRAGAGERAYGVGRDGAAALAAGAGVALRARVAVVAHLSVADCGGGAARRRRATIRSAWILVVAYGSRAAALARGARVGAGAAVAVGAAGAVGRVHMFAAGDLVAGVGGARVLVVAVDRRARACPAQQASALLQASPSSHAVPSATLLVVHLPVFVSHLPMRHGLPGTLQSSAVPAHWPALHASPVVHKAPSSQLVPSPVGAWTQPSGPQLSAVHGFWSSQPASPVAWHVPAEQTPAKQLPRSQGPAFCTLLQPLVASQLSVVQGLSSLADHSGAQALAFSAAHVAYRAGACVVAVLAERGAVGAARGIATVDGAAVLVVAVHAHAGRRCAAARGDRYVRAVAVHAAHIGRAWALVVACQGGARTRRSRSDRWRCRSCRRCTVCRRPSSGGAYPSGGLARGDCARIVARAGLGGAASAVAAFAGLTRGARLPSSHAVAGPGKYTQPLAASQLSIVQVLLSSHTMVVPPHWPLLHKSAPVQALPSLQGAPSTGVAVHSPAAQLSPCRDSCRCTRARCRLCTTRLCTRRR